MPKDLRPFHEPVVLIVIGTAAILLGSIGMLAG
jgi:hypothetical protein